MDRTLKRVAALIGSGDVESSCAALVVLTQLGSAEEAAVDAAAGALAAANVVVRDFALSYFEAVRPKTALERLLPLLDSEDDALRRRAASIVAGYGAGAIAAVRKLRGDAPRRRVNAIIEICGRVRSAAAYDLIFRIMGEGDFETNRLAGEALEAAIRETDREGRAELFKRVEAFASAVKDERVALVSALKLFGALGDARCRRRLFALLGRDRPHAVRTHALGALLQCLRGAKLSDAEIDALFPLLEEDDEAGILRPAIALLEAQDLGRKHLEPLQRLAESPQATVKRFAVHALGGFDSGAVVKTLLGYLGDASFARRNEAAASLKKTPGARLAVLKELLACDDERQAWTLAEILLSHDRSWRKDVREQLWSRFAEALDERDDRLYSPFLHVLRQLDEEATLARVRECGDALRKKRKYAEATRWLGLLRDSAAFDAEAKLALAVADLKSRKRVVSATTRRHDTAIDLLTELASGAFPLGERLRKERALAPEDLVYIGFALAEGCAECRDVAREILTHVASKSGRTKAGRAAKNKLRLLG